MPLELWRAPRTVGCLWGCRVILGLWWASELCVWGGSGDCGGISGAVESLWSYGESGSVVASVAVRDL